MLQAESGLPDPLSGSQVARSALRRFGCYDVLATAKDGMPCLSLSARQSVPRVHPSLQPCAKYKFKPRTMLENIDILGDVDGSIEEEELLGGLDAISDKPSKDGDKPSKDCELQPQFVYNLVGCCSKRRMHDPTTIFLPIHKFRLLPAGTISSGRILYSSPLHLSMA